MEMKIKSTFDFVVYKGMVDVIYVNIEPLYFEDAIHIILIHKIVFHIEHYSKPCYLKLISLFY